MIATRGRRARVRPRRDQLPEGEAKAAQRGGAALLAPGLRRPAEEAGAHARHVYML